MYNLVSMVTALSFGIGSGLHTEHRHILSLKFVKHCKRLGYDKVSIDIICNGAVNSMYMVVQALANSKRCVPSAVESDSGSRNCKYPPWTPQFVR